MTGVLGLFGLAGRHWQAGFSSVAVVLMLAGSAAAATPPAPVTPAPAQASSAISAGSQATPGGDDVSITGLTGFRSAQFGMNQADVKAAIVKDFGVKPEAINTGENPAERTQLLSVTVPDLLPGGGTAVVSYVFGYKTKNLIQIGVSWSGATDVSITESELYADGDVLRTHFMQAGYKPDSIKTGLVLDNGILLFRGEDGQGRATILILQGTFKNGADKQKTLTPTSLALLYSLNPENPDVFRLAPGQF